MTTRSFKWILLGFGILTSVMGILYGLFDSGPGNLFCFIGYEVAAILFFLAFLHARIQEKIELDYLEKFREVLEFCEKTLRENNTLNPEQISHLKKCRTISELCLKIIRE